MSEQSNLINITATNDDYGRKILLFGVSDGVETDFVSSNRRIQYYAPVERLETVAKVGHFIPDEIKPFLVLSRPQAIQLMNALRPAIPAVESLAPPPACYEERSDCIEAMKAHIHDLQQANALLLKRLCQ